LTNKRIAVGDSQNYLSEELNFEYRESRFIAINRFSDPTKYLGVGMFGNSNNSFIEANGGTLTLSSSNGILLPSFSGSGTLYLTVDNNGLLGASVGTSSGSGTTPTLANSYIGYGSGSNLLTGSSLFKWLENRYISITGSSANFNIGGASGDAFVESVNGSLLLQARSTFGVVVDDGFFKVNDLSGTGTRMVVANSTGVLSTQAIPSVGGSQSIDQVLTTGNTVYNKTLYFENPIYGHYINFRDDSSNLFGGIRSVFETPTGNYLTLFSSTGCGLKLSSAEDIIIRADSVDIGDSLTGNSITLSGTPFKLNITDFVGGTYTPSGGDKILLNWDVAKGAFVLQKINTVLASALNGSETLLKL